MEGFLIKIGSVYFKERGMGITRSVAAAHTYYQPEVEEIIEQEGDICSVIRCGSNNHLSKLKREAWFD
ncbi:hypothetical protein [Vibrio phage vB_VpaP_SJSY21]|nr:hypothetical protein [Vibrio phage vB_VpaP_SJSY21]